MSRPVRILFTGFAVVAACAFSSCVGTIYSRTYSYKKSYFKPPEEKKDLAAETALLDKKAPSADILGTMSSGAPAGADAALPPAAGGLPDPNAAPAAPGAPAATQPAPAAPPPAQ